MNSKVQPIKASSSFNSGNNRFGSEKKYTLVLDLDETLIHYVDNGDSGESYFLIRPYCN